MTDSRRRQAVRFISVYWRAALGSAYVLTAGIGDRRHRGLLVDIARHFGYDHMAVRARLPRVSLDEMVPRGLALDLCELHAVDGNVSVLELVVLAAAAARLQARTVFEIGTFDGRTTVNLAANADDGVIVYTLDLPPQGSAPALEAETDDLKYMQPGLSGARIHQSELAPRVRQLFGDSATFDFALYAGTIDLCFVDGAHSREYVLNDSRRALELTHPGSVIVWHDYGGLWRGVTQALNELREEGGAFASLRWVEGTTLAVLVRAADAA